MKKIILMLILLPFFFFNNFAYGESNWKIVINNSRGFLINDVSNGKMYVEKIDKVIEKNKNNEKYLRNILDLTDRYLKKYQNKGLVEGTKKYKLYFIVSYLNAKVNLQLKSTITELDGDKEYNPEHLSDGGYVVKYDNGNSKFSFVIKNGKFEGLFKTYYENEQVNLEVNYKNGLADGKSYKYDIYGSLLGIEIYDNGNILEKQVFEYSKNTTPAYTFMKYDIFYKNGKISYTIGYNELNQKKVLLNYNENGVLDGEVITYTTYLETSPTKLEYSRYSGPVIESKVNYVNGKREGEMIVYNYKFETGEQYTHKKLNYKNNKLNGKSYIYNYAGNVISEENYTNGFLTGIQKFYGNDGKLVFEYYYDETGKKIKSIKYNSNGKVESVVEY